MIYTPKYEVYHWAYRFTSSEICLLSNRPELKSTLSDLIITIVMILIDDLAWIVFSSLFFTQIYIYNIILPISAN